MKSSKIFEWNLTVYMEDTDQMAVVNHANYLSFFERARTEMLRSYGYTLTTMAKHGTHFAIKEAKLVYHRPARLDDRLTIASQYELSGACSILFRQSMHNQEAVLLSEAEITLVCLNDQFRPKRIPEGIF